MKKLLSSTHCLYFDAVFPKSAKSSLKKRLNVFIIGVGGNISDTKMIFKKLIKKMSENNRVFAIDTSPLFENPPFGFTNQRYFYNAVLRLHTKMYPTKLLYYLNYLERMFGRKRSFRNAPRTLDLDIIFFNNYIFKTDRLQIPHLDWSRRNFVIIPFLCLLRGDRSAWAKYF